MLLQIAIGGLETTRSAIAGLMAALLQFPEQWQRLRADEAATLLAGQYRRLECESHEHERGEQGARRLRHGSSFSV